MPGGSFDVQQEGPRGDRGSRLRATIDKIEPTGQNSNHAFYFDPLISKVVLEGDPSPTKQPVEAGTVLQISGHGIGGLEEQITAINDSLSDLEFADASLLDSHLGCPETFLIHGPEGCGKSLLLSRLAECAWRKVFTLDEDWLSANRKGSSEALSTEVFTKARELQPALVVIDDLDKFLNKGENLLNRLRQELQKLEGSQVVVAATARSVYDVDASLRTPSIFKTELELQPPNVRQREDMLRQILGSGRDTSDVNYSYLSERTHGFVGRDMHKLCSLARKRRRQLITADMKAHKVPCTKEELEKLAFVTQEDFDSVIDQVQPTVLKDSILEVPKIKWSDIAGVDHVRTLLEDITVRPYKVWPLLKQSKDIVSNSL